MKVALTDAKLLFFCLLAALISQGVSATQTRKGKQAKS